MDFKKILDALGLNTITWQWRFRRWKNYFSREKDAFESGQTAQRVQRGLKQSLPTDNFVTSLLLAAILMVATATAFVFGISAFFNPTNESLWKMGALIPFLASEGGEYWRILTYGYLHIGLIHLAFNCVALFQVGPALEREIGSSRFFTLYTVALIGGALADIVFRAPYTIVAGASGGLFGLIGFGITYCHFYGRALHPHRDFFVRWALYSFIFGFFVGADNIAHGGGFVAGAALGFLMERERQFRSRLNRVWTVIAIVCLLATLSSMFLMVKASAQPEEAPLDSVEQEEDPGI